MPNVRISDLAAADPLAAGDIVPVVQAGATRRAGFSQFRDGVLAAAGDSLIVNGGCTVAQRDPLALTDTFRYGAVDGIAARAAGTVEAGTIAQAAATLGTSGYACALTGVTLSGAAPAVAWRCPVEARDAARLAGGAATFSCRVRHDAGVAVGYTIAVNAADAADDFGAVTQVAASPA